ncbi:response regulator transcription factor [Shumkonia mesophila]|uniref:response regulator transcription factor n=1 Tax=Shumkonia mesophila TaxID=2838854 RepID=UPI002934230B|nr:response regulator transcription factor [Shumkonia mesophila]
MVDPTAKILVVDDEPQIRKFLRISLNAHGYVVVEAARGEDGITQCATEQPDLVILDLGLPDLDGQQVIARIREWSRVPILVLSVRTDEGEKVRALNNGAYDYVTKPFSIAELIARIRVGLRAQAAEETVPSRIDAGPLVIDLPTRSVMLEGQPVKLSKKEFEILRLLAVNAGRVLTHQYLLREVWGPAQAEENHYLRVYVGHLRQKLGDSPDNPLYIVTEPGVGYRFVGSR